MPASAIEAGELTDLSMSPTDFRVQVKTTIKVSFKTGHQLKEKAGVRVRLPYDLNIPEGVTELDVITNWGTVKASVSPGNIVMIPEVVPAGETLAAGEFINLKIKGVKNQNSARDAGDYVVTTMDNYGGEYYAVDTAIGKTSYVAVVGKIIPKGAIEVDNPTNSAQDVTYKLKFQLEDAIPKSGYIRVDFPETVKIVPPTARSQGSCRTYNCPTVEENRIYYLIQEGLPAD